MKIIYDLNELPEIHGSVLTIGSFDGVHSGHRLIISKVVQLAKRVSGPSILVTFHPHPRTVIDPSDHGIQLLTSTDEKIQILSQTGLDYLVVVPFTLGFSQYSAEEYVENFIVKWFKPRYIIIGYDHRFGLHRHGDVKYLRMRSQDFGYEIVEIPPQQVDQLTISSTKVRRAIQEGRLHQANDLLGYYYTLLGTVVRGDGIGNKIGFPTANIALSDKLKLIPLPGIYACYVVFEGVQYSGMLYVGKRPTVSNQDHLNIEVHIFDFDQVIYTKQISIYLVERIRDDQQFADLNSLKLGLIRDKADTLLLLKKHEEDFRKFRSASLLKSTGIVILNYNGKSQLEKFLPNLLKQKDSMSEIYVVDNASTDGSTDFVREKFPQVYVIPLDKNYGYAGGYNRALPLVINDYYILLNSDVEVTPGWVKPLIHALEKDEQVAVVQPKILSYDRKDHFEYAGAAGGWLDAFGFPFCKGRIFNVVEKDEGQFEEESQIFWASGAAFTIRADLFHRSGGFDENYFAHMEEIDLCWRLKRAGYQIRYIPSSKVYHVGGGTLSYNKPYKTYLNFKNNLHTLFKNEPVWKLVFLLPSKVVLDLFAILYFLFQYKPEHIFAVMFAHLQFYVTILLNIERKYFYNQKIDAIRIGPENHSGHYNGSIAFAYFILKHRYFSHLHLNERKA